MPSVEQTLASNLLLEAQISPDEAGFWAQYKQLTR